MPNNIIRIKLREGLPSISERNKLLQTKFGADLVIYKFAPPDNPGDLFNQLGDLVVKLNAVAIEVDTRDRILAVLLGAGVSMGAFDAPVLYPTFSAKRGRTVDTYPQIFEGTDDVLVAPDSRFSGYMEISDAKVVTKTSDLFGI